MSKTRYLVTIVISIGIIWAFLFLLRYQNSRIKEVSNSEPPELPRRFKSVFFELSPPNGFHLILEDTNTHQLYLYVRYGYSGGITPLITQTNFISK